MRAQVVAAAVGGICTIASGVITLGVKHWLDNRPFNAVSSDRRQALEGKWEGVISENAPGIPPEVSVRVDFDVSGKLISGKAEYEVLDLTRTFLLNGGFYDNEFVRVDYENANPDTIQYGIVIFKLAADGRHIEGQYLGYGITTEQLAIGTIKLEKVRE